MKLNSEVFMAVKI